MIKQYCVIYLVSIWVEPSSRLSVSLRSPAKDNLLERNLNKMADGKTHKVIGAVSGTVASLIYNSQKGNPELSLLYAAGGFIGGIKGGGLAEIIDPPDSPLHRSIGHSAVINGYIYFGKKVKNIFQDCLDWLIKKATDFMNAGNKIMYYLCHFAASILIGFAAGHGLHLIVDMFSPMTLPIIA